MIETIALDHHLRSAKAARLLVDRHLTGHARELVERAKLMVSELVTNAVKHSAAPCSVTFELTDTLLRVEVRDAGPGVPSLRSPTQDEPTGRGLLIVAALADEWGVDSTPAGNTVWFRLGLSTNVD